MTTQKPAGTSRTRRPRAPEGGERTEKGAARRAAILDAALDEFAARGFASARLDDVARRAGVAKGTIYLYFKDKQALFEELVRTNLVPHIAAIEAMPTEGPLRARVEAFAEHFVREVLMTRRADVIRLVLAEGRRFPALAEFHYREVVQRALTALQRLIQIGVERGEIRHEALVRFPQLVMAPIMMGLIWTGLFNRFAPLDVAAMMRAHLDMLFAPGREP
ncbi:TetR/AcrR family transcriptional regulator [Blastochloris sulfoviridis]|uniref:TetR/AcrR family transcriptional regulator n=1 Tax=Blastochloris sulfoviridis TaxID=50712 RepID=A0A5M6I4B7_9HYPH|nr:TetR/AcrR family transcriptional regulator [Blastochloris sulfoviridis]KAA5602707.1 TetR/AcrR family transcriptional regulator [Blastochloris sulfoviridis]